MWWKRGWILNSLNYQIEKNLRESIYTNESYKDKEWTLIERQILFWSESPKKYVMLLLVAFLLCMLCVNIWLPDIRINVTKWDQPWGDLVKWQSILLAAQLTIIGLIFPLVVGFVGLLLQNKTANRSLWLIYSQYSGFMFIGLSGLLLTGVIVFGQFAHPWLTYSTDILFSIGISFWFLFNIACAAWFLYATFRFVSNDLRNNLVSRYCTNEVLITEIKSRLSEVLPSSAVELKLLPQNSDSDNTPEIVTFYYPRDYYNKFSVHFKCNKYLNNIYYRPLYAAAYLWKLFSSYSQVKDEQPHLQLPVSGIGRSNKNWIISLSKPEIHPLIKVLLRLSYSFRTDPRLGKADIKPILNALVGEVDDALKDNNIRLFEIALDEIKDWHILLLNTAIFKNDNNEWDNWLLLPDGTFGNRSLLNELSREYYQLSRNAAHQLINSTRYYEKFCYFFLHIYGYKNEKLAGKVADELILNHYHLWMVLLDWQNSGRSINTESSVDKQLERATRSFVGSWEQWPNRLPLEINDWSKSYSVIEQHIQHLTCTARLVISSLRYDNYMAAEWAVDMMNHWFSTVFTGPDPYLHRWRDDMLVHILLGKDVTDPIWQWILNNEDLNEQAAKNDAVRTAISNTWFDVRLATAAYILNKPEKQLSSEIIRLSVALVTKARLKPGGGIERTNRNIRSGSDILEAYIRQRWYWRYGDREYSSWLDGVIESFGRIEEPEYVSGRVYSGWGSTDVRHLKHAYMVLATCYSAREWTLSARMKEFLYSDVVEFQHREILLDDLKDWLNPTEDDISKVKLYLGDSYSDDYIENMKSSIAAVIESFNRQDVAVVSGAPIDQERLLSFGKAASLSGFTIASKLIPQSFFADVEYVDKLEDDTKFINRIVDFNRSKVAQGVEINRAVNEEEWMDDIIAESVSQNIIKKLIHTTKFKEENLEDNTQLLNRIIDDASSLQKSGYKPILLVGPWSLSQLLDSMLWGYGEEISISALEIRRDDGFPNEYICHLNDVEVYKMPFEKMGFSIMVTEECFRLIKFQRINDGQYVNASYEVKEDNLTMGNLILEYRMKLHFEELPAFKYISPPNEDDG